MQKVVLLSIGSVKEPWAKEACAKYLGRLRDIKLDLRELPASKEKDPLKQATEESQRLMDVASKLDGFVIALDERGKEATSQDFAKRLQQAADHGQTIILLLGGAYGLSHDVRASADLVLKLSDMTFPHELCRVVLLEQLYRAQEINRGTGYHH